MFKAKVEGRDKVMARLRKLVPNAERELAEAQLDSAKQLATAIAARAPVRTGRYRASISGGRLAGHKGKDVRLGLLGETKDPNATGIFAHFIWRFLEYGTKGGGFGGKGISRQPHIFPTYRAMRKKIRRNMANAVNRAVRRSRR